MDILSIIAAVAGLVTSLFVIGGGFYWSGRMSNRVDRLSDDLESVQDNQRSQQEDIKSLQTDVKALQTDVKGLQADMKAVQSDVKDLQSDVKTLQVQMQTVQGDVTSLRDEVRGMRDELLGEMRRSETRILTALVNHYHVAPEAGRPVFWFPPGVDLPGVDPPLAGQTGEAPAEA